MNTFAAFYCHACGAVDRVEFLDGETEADFGHKLAWSFAKFGWRERPTSDADDPLQELWCGSCHHEFTSRPEPKPTPEAYQAIRREKTTY
jgi:hypothetical protein